MCGIYGRWRLDGEPLDVGAVQRATTLLRHRGPDDEGYLLAGTSEGRVVHCGGPDSDPRLRLPRVETLGSGRFDLALGFRRLAILDLSPAGHQPMASPDGRHWIVYNGEIYNFAELRTELAGFGHSFRSDSDTEVILAAYRQWGADCLHRFNGMWALAIWDGVEQSLFLARDRFGVKPLFYSGEGRDFAFASEIKALVGGHGVPFRPADGALYDYVALGLLPSPGAGDTFFEGVRALPPGYLMRVTRSGTSLARYYRLPEAGDEVDDAGLVDRYAELLTDAVRLRLRADVPVGSCLSGGLDSSSIVCLVNRLITTGGQVAAAAVGDHQKTFSAVYDTDGPYNERVHIDRVLHATRAEGSFVVPTAERLLRDAERMVWHQDEPFASTSIFAQWCVMATVKERGVTVLLDGQGADEALAGYRPFEVFVGEMIRSLQLSRLVAELRALRQVAGVSPPRLVARSIARHLPGALKQAHRRRTVRRESTVLRGDFSHEHGQTLRGASFFSMDELLRDQLTEGSLPHLLRYEDRNSMAFSVEARVPFVDYRLVELSVTRASRLRIREGWTKWVLRRAMQGVVPEEILWRRDKVGFETPEAPWLHAWLRQAPDFFDDGAKSAAYLDLRTVRDRLRDFADRGGDTRRVWRWINLELWLRQWTGN